MSAHDNYRICKKYMNRHVAVTTRYGQVYQGQIIKVDSKHVYLKVDPYHARHCARTSAFFFPGAFIIPLVLFDLLAIALLF
ncbi:hypothetical protein LJK88_18390 [Paenibacillus sp. P26]|nr:hypothetical protein LJK88_18390 [Paenibacillus sp. P26]UUZ96297.1 hypothetical protein LJK87_19425 [Paenibacillus sp. P25]